MYRFSSKSVGVLALAGLGCCLSSAAVLSIPGQTANKGSFLVSGVSLASEGARISGVQFDLTWDDGLQVNIAGGIGLANAGKLVYAAQLGTRQLRVLVAGVNDGVFPDGEVIRLFVGVNSPGTVTLTNVTGVTADGDPVALGTSDGAVRLDSSMPVNSILAQSVLNADSLQPGPVAPGEVITLLGAFGINADTSRGVVVNANRAPAAMLYALGNQVNAILPLNMDPANPVELEVRDANRQLARITMPAAAASPALFTQNGTGIGPGAILNQDYSRNSAATPAALGSIVMMYGTSFGPLKPSDGILPPQTALTVTATIGGAAADVIYAGAAPGLPEGVVQINVRIPNTVSGDSLPISLSAGSFSIPNGVTVTVR